MELIPYNQFERLRLRDFLEPNARPNIEESGFECAIGLAGYEGFPSTYFAWPSRRPRSIGQISVGFDGVDISTRSAIDIIRAINLPLTPGQVYGDVIGVLGQPVSSFRVDDRETVEFLVGEKWPYKVLCFIVVQTGLVAVTVFQKRLEMTE